MKKKRCLIILGAGEYGQLVKEIAEDKYTSIVFLDDKSSLAKGKLEEFKNYCGHDAIVAIGNNEIRLQWIKRLEREGFKMPSIISNKAIISKNADISEACIIEPMAAINHGALIKRGCIISSGAVINHNAVINEGSHIDCNSTVGSSTIVPSFTHLEYGQVIKRNI